MPGRAPAERFRVRSPPATPSLHTCARCAVSQNGYGGFQRVYEPVNPLQTTRVDQRVGTDPAWSRCSKRSPRNGVF